MLPQSYDFISKPARAFWEKFLKKLEIAFFMREDKGLDTCWVDNMVVAFLCKFPVRFYFLKIFRKFL